MTTPTPAAVGRSLGIVHDDVPTPGRAMAEESRLDSASCRKFWIFAFVRHTGALGQMYNFFPPLSKPLNVYGALMRRLLTPLAL